MKWLFLLLLFPALVFAGEDCSMLNGICREVCADDEVAEKGAFLDCTDKQECCVKKEVTLIRDNKLPLEDRDRDQRPIRRGKEK